MKYFINYMEENVAKNIKLCILFLKHIFFLVSLIVLAFITIEECLMLPTLSKSNG